MIRHITPTWSIQWHICTVKTVTSLTIYTPPKHIQCHIFTMECRGKRDQMVHHGQVMLHCCNLQPCVPCGVVNLCVAQIKADNSYVVHGGNLYYQYTHWPWGYESSHSHVLPRSLSRSRSSTLSSLQAMYSIVRVWLPDTPFDTLK